MLPAYGAAARWGLSISSSLDRLSSGPMVLGLGLGVDSYGEYPAFDEPAVDDRARAAALDARIEPLEPMLAGRPLPSAGALQAGGLAAGDVALVGGVHPDPATLAVAARRGASRGSSPVRPQPEH